MKVKICCRLIVCHYLLCRFVKLAHNGLQLELVRLWNTRLPKRLNKDTMFLCICKEKINVFREAALFANALMSARISFRCCYVPFYFVFAFSKIWSCSPIKVAGYFVVGLVRSSINDNSSADS